MIQANRKDIRAIEKFERLFPRPFVIGTDRSDLMALAKVVK